MKKQNPDTPNRKQEGKMKKRISITAKTSGNRGFITMLLVGIVLMASLVTVPTRAHAQCRVILHKEYSGTGRDAPDRMQFLSSVTDQGFKQSFYASTSFYEDLMNLPGGIMSGDPQAYFLAFSLLTPKAYVKDFARAAALDATLGFDPMGFVPEPEDIYDYFTSGGVDFDPTEWNDEMDYVQFNPLTAGACDYAQVLLYEDKDFKGDMKIVSFTDGDRTMLADIGWGGRVSSYMINFGTGLRVTGVWTTGRTIEDIAISNNEKYLLTSDGEVFGNKRGLLWDFDFSHDDLDIWKGGSPYEINSTSAALGIVPSASWQKLFPLYVERSSGVGPFEWLCQGLVEEVDEC